VYNQVDYFGFLMNKQVIILDLSYSKMLSVTVETNLTRATSNILLDQSGLDCIIYCTLPWLPQDAEA
jgi:hypothetical protein